MNGLGPGIVCQGTIPALQKGNRGSRNQQPSRPRGANRLRTAAPSGFPAMPMAPALGRGRARELKLTGERAEAGVGERKGARRCAQLGQPPLLRLSPSVLESSSRCAAAVFCSRAQARHPPEVPPLPPLPPPGGYLGNRAGELRLRWAVLQGLVGVGLTPGCSCSWNFLEPLPLGRLESEVSGGSRDSPGALQF